METPLNVAINSNNILIIKTLFEHANTKGIILANEPVIITAVKTGNIEIVKTICENGFDVNETDDKYISALHQAVANNAMEIIEYLANYISVDVQDINEKTPLHYAYEYGNEKNSCFSHRKWREPTHKRRNESHSFAYCDITFSSFLL